MTRVFAITPSNLIAPEVQLSTTDNNNDTATRALKMEKFAHVLESQERKETFEDILDNKQLEYHTLKYILSWLSCIVGAIISISIYTLIPRHNVIEFPQYWYEAPIEWFITFGPLSILHMIYTSSFQTNIKHISCLLYTSDAADE